MTCSARYKTTAGATYGTAETIIDFGTKVSDSDDAVTTGASWKFVCPTGKGGLYLVTLHIGLNAWAGINQISAYIGANRDHYLIINPAPSTSYWYFGTITTVVRLAEADEFNLRMALSAATKLSATAGVNEIFINRIGD